MTDSHYTPTALALDLVALSKKKRPKVVADFAVGPGSLLYAAKISWPTSELHGLDLDSTALGEVRDKLGEVFTYHVDYLTDRAMELTKGLQGNIDIVLLNPPFTCRGATFVQTIFEGQVVRSSKAMAFILRSCQFLRSNGEILAIVPRSCLLSQKDAEARRLLTLSHSIEDMGKYKSPGFADASVSVHLIRLTRHRKTKIQKKQIPAAISRITPKQDFKLFVMRGSHPVGDVCSQGVGPSLIHTTELFDSQISINRRRATRTRKAISGSVLMMPRVARPSIKKIAVGSFMKPVVPSDCIICVKTEPAGFETELLEKFRHYWELLKDAYSGTCASYLTLASFRQVAEQIGFDVEFTDDPEIWNPTSRTISKQSKTISYNEG